MSNAFSKVPTGNPRRHFFGLHPNKKFDCHVGELIPFKYFECIPGDKVKINQQSVVRLTPLMTPVMHDVYLYTWYFFVPTRILFKDEDSELYDKDKLLELFFGGGRDGKTEISLPKYTDTSISMYSSLDYLGYPLTLPTVGDDYKGVLPFPNRAYNCIYNNFFRDENLIDEIDLDSKTVQRVAWRKDYFTSSLPFQQRGDATRIDMPLQDSPIYVKNKVDAASYWLFGNLSTTNTGGVTTDWNANGKSDYAQIGDFSFNSIQHLGVDGYAYIEDDRAASLFASYHGRLGRNDFDNFDNVALSPDIGTLNAPLMIDQSGNNLLYASNKHNAVSLFVNDLRVSFQAQRFLERNALAGVRYTELLKAHFNIAPADEVLQRPQYIGGTKSPILISEVEQNSESGTTPQGTLKGKGLNADISSIGTYTVKEFGYIIGLSAIRPELGYCAQGINRDLLRYTKYDFPFPAFMMLGERSVYNCEIYANTNDPFGIFGYQGQFNELRADNNQVAGGFRSSSGYKQWHMNRSFASLPNLGKDFIECSIDKSCFANTSQDVRECLCTIQTDVDFYRPIPHDAEPGLIDHIYGG